MVGAVVTDLLITFAAQMFGLFSTENVHYFDKKLLWLHLGQFLLKLF
jgi:hypothetical protein